MKLLHGDRESMLYRQYLKKRRFFFEKVPPIGWPQGGILTFLRKIFAPYRVGGQYYFFLINEIETPVNEPFHRKRAFCQAW